MNHNDEIPQHRDEVLNTGPAAAAFVSAGLGCAALGFFTTLAEISPAAKNFLNWWNPGGPLTGKTGMAVAIWLIVWIILHIAWRRKPIGITGAIRTTLALIGLGVIGTFPTFFEYFSH